MPVPDKGGLKVEVKEGVPVLSFADNGSRVRGQRICTFLIDVQIIEVNAAGVRLQEYFGEVLGRVHVFKPTRQQMEILTPYLWTKIKLEAVLILPDIEQKA